MRFCELIWKNLCRRPARSLLTAMGVMVATAAVMSLLSVAAALTNRSAEVYNSRGVDIVVIRTGVAERLSSNLSESLAGRLKELPGVADLAGALSDMVVLHGEGIVGVPLSGWRTDSFLFELLEIVAGRRLQSDDQRGIMLGAVLAETLHKQVGNEVEIEGESFHVIGVYRTESVWENGSAVLLLADMQELMDRRGQVTEYQIRAEPGLSTEEGGLKALCRQIEQLEDNEGRRLGLSAMPTDEHVTSEARINLVHSLAWITTAIALVIGSIGMLNTMMMALLERTQEIGTLRAIGWRRLRIVGLILGESLALSILGAAAGTCAAWLSLNLLKRLPAIRGDISPHLTLVALTAGVVVTILFGVLGGGYPAYRGASLLPAEAIHEE